jgi:lactonase
MVSKTGESVGLVMSLIAAVCFGLHQGSANAEPSGLSYRGGNSEPVPIPPSEVGLQTVVAEPYFKVSDKGLQFEGASFDRDGNLLFVEVFGGRVFRLSPDKQLTTVVPENSRGSAGLAIHKDGHIYVAGLGNFKGVGGSVVVVGRDGSNPQTLIGSEKGYLIDDIVFDAHGGFYFSDFRGTTAEPTGGVYYVAPGSKKITPVLSHLAVANGIALSPDGKVLWIGEFSRSLLHRVELSDATTIAPAGTTIPYRFTGMAPDSMRVDADGNLYVAMYSQGRVLVFNSVGIPIGQVLIPGRERGHNMRSTSMAIRPGTNDLYILSNDSDGGEGATIFHTKSFAKSLRLYSHQ